MTCFLPLQCHFSQRLGVLRRSANHFTRLIINHPSNSAVIAGPRHSQQADCPGHRKLELRARFFHLLPTQRYFLDSFFKKRISTDCSPITCCSSSICCSRTVTSDRDSCPSIDSADLPAWKNRSRHR